METDFRCELKTYRVAQGLTQEITIYGDFMATRSMQEITDALTGCQFRPEAVAERLKQFLSS